MLAGINLKSARSDQNRAKVGVNSGLSVPTCNVSYFISCLGILAISSQMLSLIVQPLVVNDADEARSAEIKDFTGPTFMSTGRNPLRSRSVRIFFSPLNVLQQCATTELF